MKCGFGNCTWKNKSVRRREEGWTLYNGEQVG